jgi:hypothetical protein
MKRAFAKWAGIFMCAAGLATAAVAQQANSNIAVANAQMRSYTIARESVLQGTVIKYTPTSSTPPLGAHILLQTSSGVVDVHAGSDKYLQFSKLTLQPGDELTITGEYIAYGGSKVYAARIIQKDGRSVAVRSARGFPLSPVTKGDGSRGGLR